MTPAEFTADIRLAKSNGLSATMLSGILDCSHDTTYRLLRGGNPRQETIARWESYDGPRIARPKADMNKCDVCERLARCMSGVLSRRPTLCEIDKMIAQARRKSKYHDSRHDMVGVIRSANHYMSAEQIGEQIRLTPAQVQNMLRTAPFVNKLGTTNTGVCYGLDETALSIIDDVI